jgi:hypothetical protein
MTTMPTLSPPRTRSPLEWTSANPEQEENEDQWSQLDRGGNADDDPFVRGRDHQSVNENRQHQERFNLPVRQPASRRLEYQQRRRRPGGYARAGAIDAILFYLPAGGVGRITIVVARAAWSGLDADLLTEGAMRSAG